MRARVFLPFRAVFAAVIVASVAGPAYAQSIDETRAQADALFREGQQLLTAGQVDAACPKLEESERLDPKLGRLLNVAYCHQKQGRIASAWREYDQAAALAIQTRQKDREKFARDQATALSRQLAFVRLNLDSPPDGAQVSVDGKPLARDQWPLPFAVDPGPHTVEVRAPGYTTRSQSITVTGTGSIRVDVPALEKDESAAPAAAPPLAAAPAPTTVPQQGNPAPAAAVAEQPASPANTRTLGWIVGGAGVVALGLGVGFGVDAMSLKSQADSHCPNHLCDPTGLSQIDSAKTAATISTIGLAVGVVGVGAGAWLLLRSPSHPGASAAAIAPFVAADRAGVAVRGSW